MNSVSLMSKASLFEPPGSTPNISGGPVRRQRMARCAPVVQLVALPTTVPASFTA